MSTHTDTAAPWHHGTHAPVVVIGGGVAGLVAANRVANAGLPVTLLEKASAPGGRATTRERDGFLFNLGPHALYRCGQLRRTLTELGVDVKGALPNASGGFALYRGAAHTLPVGLASLMTTGLLTMSGKLDLARAQTRLPRIDPASLQRETVASWLQEFVRDERVRQVFEMLIRVTTFTNDPNHQSAGAAIEQLQLALAGNVLYLDGGWQTIVDGLKRAALARGVRIVTSAPAAALERRDSRDADAVRLADGRVLPLSAAIIAAGPNDVDALTGDARMVDRVGAPVRVATLDLALRRLPRPKATVAFGVDTPWYFSVHSAVARLAPAGGALIHVTKYLRPSEAAGRDVEEELETVADLMQPGWREQVVSRHYLPTLQVTHSSVTAARGGMAGRPSSQLDEFDNVFIAGDWVGPRGQLSDASAASAAEAAELAVHAVQKSATVVQAFRAAV
jgi:phytoene dehydrogenase-like protein